MEGRGLATLGVITRAAPPLASDGTAGPAGTRVNITSDVIMRRDEEKLAWACYNKIKAVFKISLLFRVQIEPLGLWLIWVSD